MKVIYCLLILLSPSCGMSQKAVAALTIGDTMPSTAANIVFNYPTATIHLSDFKGKLLILDFMRTNCPSCLEKMVLFHQLQKQFEGRLQFIFVSSESAIRVKKFLKTHRLGKAISLPFIAGDTLLKNLFPHETISHLVWIGSDDIVKAITHGEYVTAANIQSVLQGKPNQWPIKKDIIDFDYHQTLVSVDPQVQRIAQTVPLTSSLLPYIPEVGSRNILSVADSFNNTVRTAFYNRPITELYLGLYGKTWFPRTQIILQVKDSSRYILDESKTYWHGWMQQNSYCYESISPSNMSLKEQRQRISSELDFYLGINGRMEERELPCLILCGNGNTATQPSSDSESFTLSTIVYELNQIYSGIPVFIDTLVDAHFKISVARILLRSRTALEHILNTVGFEFKLVMRKVEVLVISEKDGSSSFLKKE